MLALESLGAPVDLRFARRGFFGSDVVMDVLVADMKLLLATLRTGVGKARRIRCDVGIEFVGKEVWLLFPKTFICEGGIQGARR